MLYHKSWLFVFVVAEAEQLKKAEEKTKKLQSAREDVEKSKRWAENAVKDLKVATRLWSSSGWIFMIYSYIYIYIFMLYMIGLEDGCVMLNHQCLRCFTHVTLFGWTRAREQTHAKKKGRRQEQSRFIESEIKLLKSPLRHVLFWFRFWHVTKKISFNKLHKLGSGNLWICFFFYFF